MKTLPQVIAEFEAQRRAIKIRQIKSQLGDLLDTLDQFNEMLETPSGKAELRDFRSSINAYYDSFDWMK